MAQNQTAFRVQSTVFVSLQVNHKFYKEEGEAGHKLCHIAKDEHITLIVMGTRGLGTIRRTILGSFRIFRISFHKVTLPWKLYFCDSICIVIALIYK